MKSRIEILKEIMETEKLFAMGEINSETFEDIMQNLEKQLKLAQRVSEEEIENAVDSKEVPLFAHSLIGSVSIEELFPSFNVPRTFYRHLKIRREIIELRKNINQLKKDLKKTQILLAEKKITPETADLRYERLEFDLRLAENRLSARQKYLKRNPTKGDLLQFTLKNYSKFSFGHGVEDQEELQETAQQLNEEIELRKKYREALAEMLATVKTSQLEISSAKTRNGLPDFKQLRDYQNTINELYTYIRLLSEDIQSYNNCLTSLQKYIVLL
jgi:hypothetical protein